MIYILDGAEENIVDEAVIVCNSHLEGRTEENRSWYLDRDSKLEPLEC